MLSLALIFSVEIMRTVAIYTEMWKMDFVIYTRCLNKYWICVVMSNECLI